MGTTMPSNLQLYTQPPPSCEVTSWIYGFIGMDIEISAVHIQDLFPTLWPTNLQDLRSRNGKQYNTLRNERCCMLLNWISMGLIWTNLDGKVGATSGSFVAGAPTPQCPVQIWSLTGSWDVQDIQKLSNATWCRSHPLATALIFWMDDGKNVVCEAFRYKMIWFHWVLALRTQDSWCSWDKVFKFWS